MQLPKFTIVEQDGRFLVETNWCIPDEKHPFVRHHLMLTTSGRLSLSGVSWGSRAKAEENIQRCKDRLRR